jgi:hypothetical protein
MTSMHGLTIGLTVVFFAASGMWFWLLADERGLILWLLFGFGAYSLGRRYQYDHATGPPVGEEGSPSSGG